MEDNQTYFGLEKPLFEEPPRADQPVAPVTSSKGPKVIAWIKAHRMLTIGLAVVGMAGLLAMALLVGTPRESGRSLLNLDQDTSEPQGSLTPLEQKVEDLKTELKEADPASGQEHFPPVDLNIRLENPR